MSISELQQKDTYETVIHEVGHALCGMALGASQSLIVLYLNPNHSLPDFVSMGQTYVRGKNFHPLLLPDNLSNAAVGYAGLLGLFFWNDGALAFSNDDLFKAIHSVPDLWSSEDLALVAMAGSEERKRESFDRAVAVLKQHRSALIDYSHWIAKAFLQHNSESSSYTVPSLTFAIPVRNLFDTSK